MLTGLLGLVAAGCSDSSSGGGGFVPTTTTKKKKSNPPPPPPPPPPSSTPSLSLTTPTEGDLVALDVPLTVSWTSANLTGTTVLSFSSDGGQSYTPIASGLPASGSTTWSPTGLTSARLRIESTGGAVVDEHTADFEFRRVWFVDPTATGAGDGTTWADAVGRLQVALSDLAAPGDLIWVSNQTTLTAFDVSDAAVAIVRQQAGLYGGFTGTETALSQRPATLTRTTIDGQGTQSGFRVISSTAAVTTIDGFRVTGGASPGSGGGLFANNSAVALVDCVLELSSATHWGGGAAFIDCPAVTVTDCTFDQNVAGTGGGGLFAIGSSGTLDVESSTFTKNTLTSGDGGGMSVRRSGLTVTVTDSTFSENVAVRDGGGLYTNQGSPSVAGCEFLKNTSGRNGGGVVQIFGTTAIAETRFEENESEGEALAGPAIQLPFGGGGLYVETVSPGRVERSSFFANTTTNGAGLLNVQGTVTLENCVLADNTAAGLGGGVFTTTLGRTHLAFCTLTRNSASKGAGFGMMHNPLTSTIKSSILFGDVADELGVFEDRPLNVTVTDSDVGQVDITGTGVINADPLFVNPGTRDFTLDAGSPAIGAGNPTGAPAEDFDGEPRDAAPDMGAFERQ
jgi:hypothetical protein